MITYYRIRRYLLTLFSTLINKVIMILSGVCFGKGFKSCGKIFIRNYAGKNGIIIRNNVNFNSGIIANPIGGVEQLVLMTSSTGHIEIGNKVGMSNCVLFSSSEILIDNEVCIGAGTKIYDTDFHSVNPDFRLNGNINIPTKPVRIGKRAFIGSNVTILKGVTIGEEAVVGAGSVVTKDIPAHEIWAGNPAKFIKKIPDA